jgi:hypothetical protein
VRTASDIDIISWRRPASGVASMRNSSRLSPTCECPVFESSRAAGAWVAFVHVDPWARTAPVRRRNAHLGVDSEVAAGDWASGRALVHHRCAGVEGAATSSERAAAGGRCAHLHLA